MSPRSGPGGPRSAPRGATTAPGAAPEPLQRPPASLREQGRRPEASREPFWSHFGSIFDPPGHHFQRCSLIFLRFSSTFCLVFFGGLARLPARSRARSPTFSPCLFACLLACCFLGGLPRLPARSLACPPAPFVFCFSLGRSLAPFVFLCFEFFFSLVRSLAPLLFREPSWEQAHTQAQAQA